MADKTLKAVAHLLGFPVMLSEHLLVAEMPTEVHFSDRLPTWMMLGTPFSIFTLPQRTENNEFLLEGGKYMQIAVAGGQVFWMAFAFGCLWAARHEGIVSRFPVAAVWSLAEWSALEDNDREQVVANRLLMLAPKAFDDFQARMKKET